MMRSIALLSLAALLGAEPSHPVAAPAPSALAADREIWTVVIGWVTTAAEQVPDSSYSYRPAADGAHVRSSSSRTLPAPRTCSAPWRSAYKATASDEIEKTTTAKSALVAALKASTELCKKAYAMTDADAANRPVRMFVGERIRRSGRCSTTRRTTGEHYGNIVTYMRMLGMVPPSSQPMR